MPTMTRAGYKPPKSPGRKRPDRPRKKKGKKRRRMGAATAVSLAIFLLAVCAGAGTLALYARTAPYRDAYLPGTSLEGYALDGMPREQGAALLRELTGDAVADWRFEIEAQGTGYALTAQDVALAVDESATLDALWQRGRGGPLAIWLDMLALRREPMDAEIALRYDMAAADELLARVKADVDCAPVDATVAFVPGSSTPFRFTEEELGYALDTAPLRSRIEAAILALTPESVRAEPEVLEPDVYEETLRGATVLRARVTMAMQADENASANAALAARALNGLRVEPGGTLSFNEAVGPRTAERGYVSAPEPAYGDGAEGVGGGVCQTATALYQAALLGGVTVEQRSAAARPVPYAPAGQEAAVSDQGLDLAIKNEGDTPLFLTARAYGGDAPVLEVQLIGAPLEERYALESSVTELPAPEEPVYVRDSEGLYASHEGEMVPVVEAQPGYAARVERVTLDGEGNALSRETVSEDQYAPIAQAIYVGVRSEEE